MKFLWVSVFCMLMLSGCGSDGCDAAEKSQSHKRFAYLDRQVFVYPTAELFELEQPVLLDSAIGKLAPVIAFAQKHPGLRITIASYATDASNSRYMNEQRDFAAEVVAASLWVNGVKNPVRYKGFKGGEHSVSSNRIASIGVDNRRIEIEFYDQKHA